MHQDTYVVLIVGAGRIGAFFDEPASDAVLTHAHAFSCHPRFKLLGFVDADPRSAELAATRWGGEAFVAISDAFARQTIDVVVVAVPDEDHLSILRELASYPFRLVFVEKPLATTVAGAESVIALYREKNIRMAVNYSRRYVPEFAALRDWISAGRMGCFIAGTGYYGKGTIHNGSHMIDLLRFFLGEISVETVISSICDWRDDDPTNSAILKPDIGGQFILLGVDCRLYTIFEMDLLFEKGRVRLIDSGFCLEESETGESQNFADYRVLTDPIRTQTGFAKALAMAAESISENLDKNIPLPCTGDDGVKTLAVCTAIIDGLR